MNAAIYDAIVIGAGFFGIEISLELRRLGFERILLVEREAGVMRRASYVNQARVHNGYHYPRSLATAERSRANFDAFVAEYADVVMAQMESVYAIARGGRVNAEQFETFCRILGAPCQPAPRQVVDLFESSLIEAAFVTREFAFDSSMLAKRLTAEMERVGIAVRLNSKATVQHADADGAEVLIDDTLYRSSYVFNCTYSDLEFAGIGLRSGIKKELAEIVLISPPPELRNLGITVMDGPFFSTMPFPAAGLHSLSHVRYTPHESYETNVRQSLVPRKSNATAIVRDSQRYLPCLARARVAGSVFEVKAILTRNEHDDGRPILIERSEQSGRLLSVLGAKIDNIYEVRRFLRAQQWRIGR